VVDDRDVAVGQSLDQVLRRPVEARTPRELDERGRLHFVLG
jgi:hypothetical protein